MKEVLTQYEIADHGAHKPELIHVGYTRYNHFAYGSGKNFAEAFEDALEQVAQRHDPGPLADEELIEIIKRENADAQQEHGGQRYVGIHYNLHSEIQLQ